MPDTDVWTYHLVCVDPDENTNKFWKARVDGKMLYVNYGRNGTLGATQVKALNTPEEAVREMNDRVTEKKAKGYYNWLGTGGRNSGLPGQYKPPAWSGSAAGAWDPPSKPANPGVVTYYSPFNVPMKEKPAWIHPVVYQKPPDPVKAPLPAYKANELDKIPEQHFRDLYRRVQLEEQRRKIVEDLATDVRSRVKKNDHITAFQTFLLGCAHAMACRAALRWSAGHTPYGTHPMSGKPWSAYDGTVLAELVRTGEPPVTKDFKVAEVWAKKRLRSNPMTWKTKGDLLYWLAPARYSNNNQLEYLH